MKFFSNALMILASLALCTGCSSEPIGSHDSSAVQADGGSNDGGDKPDANSNPDYWDWKDITVISGFGYTLIEGKTPDNKPATFYVCSNCPNWKGGVNSDQEKDPCINMREPELDHLNDTVIYKDVISFKHPDTASIQFGSDFTVCVERKNHLFVPYHFNIKGAADPKTTTGKSLEWKDIGSWGLAPNGMYTSSKDGKQKKITTSVKNGEVTLTYGTTDAIVTHDAFSPNDQDPDLKLSGEIADDLSKIQLKAEFPNLPDKNYETTLTIVK